MFKCKNFSIRHTQLFLLLAAVVLSNPAYAAKETAWKMVQKEKSLGIQTINFSSKAVKIVDKGRGFTLVSTAPDWDVILYRDDDKVFCKLTRKQYYGQQAFQVKHGHTPGKVLKNYTFGPVTAPMYYGPYHNDVIKRFDGVPIEVEDLIASFFKANCVDGIVLRSISNSMTRSKTDSSVFMPVDLNPTGVLRETLSLNTVPYNAFDYKVPPNLRKVNSMKEIATGKSKRKEAESIFLEMGVGDDLGKSSGK